jgi:hypothetical protein
MSTVRRTCYVNPIEPGPLSMRVPAGMETRLDVTFHDIGGALLHVDVLPQLQLIGRSSGGPALVYAMPATDVVNGRARAVIPSGDLLDANGYQLRLYGTWKGEPILLAAGIVAITDAQGIVAVPADVIDSIDITLNRGTAAALNVTLWVDTAKSQPYDLTAVTVAAAIYESHGGPQLVPFAIGAITGNTVQITLTADQVTALPDSCWWNLTVSDAAGVTTLCEGMVTVL